jgi:hypothetical protein
MHEMVKKAAALVTRIVLFRRTKHNFTSRCRGRGSDFGLIAADHGPQLVVEELVPAVFTVFVNQTQSPTESMIFSRSTDSVRFNR